MNLELTDRVRKLEIQVMHLLRRVNKPEIKVKLKSKKFRRHNDMDQQDAVRDWMRKTVLMRDQDFRKGCVFTNAEGRRFVSLDRMTSRYMRVRAAFRDGQVLLSSTALRSLLRKVLSDMDLPVIDYPKRVDLTTTQPVVEIPAYGRHPSPDYFPQLMTVADRAGVGENACVSDGGKGVTP